SSGGIGPHQAFPRPSGGARLVNRPGAGRRFRLLPDRRGDHPRPRRRVGLRQDDHLQAGLRPGAAHRGHDPLRGRRRLDPGRQGVAYLFIAHDLAAVAHMSDTIAVMYLGRIVELGEATAVALDPKHPYTQALFAAALPIDLDRRVEEIALSGEVPSPLDPPSG